MIVRCEFASKMSLGYDDNERREKLVLSDMSGSWGTCHHYDDDDDNIRKLRCVKKKLMIIIRIHIYDDNER